VLYFFSERLVWTMLWPDTGWSELAITWLAYSAVAYLFLAIVRWSRADDLPSVFMAGAVYGWLIEGGLAPTLYGTESSAPFPLSISLTALSWHALISAVVGWWATKRALAAASPWPLAAMAAAVGLFWGVWAMFPRRESPPVLVSPARFAAEAVALTVMLGASWRIAGRAASKRAFRPGWVGLAISTLAVGVFYRQHVMALGARPLILLPTLVGAALVLLAVHRRRRIDDSGNVTEAILVMRPVRLLGLFVMPAVGTIVFGLAAAAGWDQYPVANAVYLVTGAAGFALAIISTGVIAWHRVAGH
jgi:hypothetical protein